LLLIKFTETAGGYDLLWLMLTRFTHLSSQAANAAENNKDLRIFIPFNFLYFIISAIQKPNYPQMRVLF